MADDIKTRLRQSPLILSRLSGGRLTAAIIGGGFLLGMLAGVCFWFGRSETGTDPTPVAETATTARLRSSASESTTPPVRSTDRSDELAAERDRLQRELQDEKIRREVESLRRELASLKTSPVSTEPEPPTVRSRPASPSPASPVDRRVSPGEATLSYWNRMNAIILQEAAMRSAPAGGVTAGNATGFLDARIQAAEFAVESIEQLDTDGVDPRVVELGDQLASWYAEGRQVAETGRQLLTRSSIQERQGSAGKMYQSAERKHSKNVNTLNANGEQVRQAMTRKYGLNFPPLN